MNSAFRRSVSIVIFCIGALNAHAQNASGALPAVKSAAPKFAVDPHAMELLQQNQEAMLRLKTYQAECRTTITQDHPTAGQPPVKYQLSFLRAARPNLMRYDSWTLPAQSASIEWTRPSAVALYTFACDGKDHWRQYGESYRKANAAPAYLNTILEPWIGFYMPQTSAYSRTKSFSNEKALIEARIVGTETVDGVPCEKVFIHALTKYVDTRMEYRTTWYLDSGHLVRRCVDHVDFSDKPSKTWNAVLCNIKLNEQINPAEYAYTPPAGVSLMVDPKPTPLLASGTTAPDFTALDKENKPLKLSDYRGKVVILDFWASWCGPCMASMPHNQSVARKLAKAGFPVVLVAIDNGEERESFDKWVKTTGLKFPDLKFAHVSPAEDVSGKLYSVTGIPTQYIIDKAGVIRAMFVGYDGGTSELEKAVRAALKGQ